MTTLVSVHDLAFEDLIEAKKLTREGLDRAQAEHEREGGALADWLFALGLVGERDLLRALAHRLGRQYVTLYKVAGLEVDTRLLERVPVRLAEKQRLLPFRVDEDLQLWVVATHEVADDDLRDELLAQTGAKGMVVVLALGAAVRAAIRRHYYAQADAFEHVTRGLPGGRFGAVSASTEDDLSLVTGSPVCPACGAAVQLDAFQCPACQLLLNPDECQELTPDEPISIVQGLLLPPDQWPQSRAEKTPVIDRPNGGTTKEVFGLPPEAVLQIVVGLDEVDDLSPYEAKVFVRVDGRKSVEQLAAEMRISPLELGFTLGSLEQRGYLAVAPRAPARLMEPSSDSLSNESQRALQMAVSLELVGEWQAAVKALATGIDRTKNPAPLLNKLALLLIARKRDWAAAETLLERAAKLEPKSEVYRKNLEQVRRRSH